VSLVILLAIFVVIVCFAVLEASRQRMSQRLDCPRDGEEREVIFEASSMEPDHWTRVVACGRPGGPLVSAERLTCHCECRRTACHSRTGWAPEPVARSRR